MDDVRHGALDGLAAVRLGAVALREVPFAAQVNVRTSDPDALGLPRQSNTAVAFGARTALWLGPDEWLIVGADEDEQAIAEELLSAGGDVSVVDLSANRTVLELTGPLARDVLMQGVLPTLGGVLLPRTPKFSTEGRVVGTLGRNNLRLRYEKFKGQVGGSDIAGTLEYVQQEPRPILRGEVVSNKLVWKDLGAVVGAVVGEFVGGEAGLGYMLMVANGSMDTPLLFAGLIALTIQGVALYALVEWAEHLAIPRRSTAATAALQSVTG